MIQRYRRLRIELLQSFENKMNPVRFEHERLSWSLPISVVAMVTATREPFAYSTSSGPLLPPYAEPLRYSLPKTGLKPFGRGVNRGLRSRLHG